MIIDLLFFMRFLSDYFWENKIFTIVSALFLTIYVTYLILIRFKDQGLVIYRSELIALIFLSLILINSFNPNISENYIILFKLVASLLCFFLGSSISNFNPRYTYIFYLPILFLVIISYANGSGFIYWGSVHTFSGGYYFKTDLALALSVFIVFVLLSDINERKKYLASLICSYLVFLSNARIFYFIYPLIIVMYSQRSFILNNANRIMSLSILYSFMGLALVSLIFYAISLSSIGSEVLLFDFSNGYSEANTQGRNIIWENLLDHYVNSSFLDMSLGAGLTADVRYSESLSSLSGVHAHNSFLYILVSVGFIGLIVFCFLIYYVLKRFSTIARDYKSHAEKEKILLGFLIFLMIFIITSLTNVTIVYQQLSWFFFFYSGLLFNKNIFQPIKNQRYRYE